MSDVTNKRVHIYIDQASAEDALGKLQTKADGFSSKIQKCRDEQTKLLAEIKKSEAAGKDVTNLQSKYDTLGTRINAYNKSLKDTSESQAKLKQQIDSGIAPSFNQLSRYVSNLHNELKNLSKDAPEYAAKFEAFRKASAQLNGLKDSMSLVEKAQKSLFSQAPAIAFGVLIGNTVQGIAQSLMGYLGSFVSFKSEFQNSIANLSAITGATGNDLDFLKTKAIEFSKTGVRSAKDYVEAFKLIASAKPELLQQKESLADVAKQAALLADAAGIELPDAATRLTDALNQFGAPAEQAGLYVDALAAAAKYGAAEVPQVTEALLQFGTQAKSTNVNIFESSALIELLAEKGIKGAEAGTKLRNVLLALNAVDALDKKALDSLESAGVKIDVLSNKSLSLKDRLTELSKVQNNASALVNIFGKENFNAAQIVLQNINRYDELAGQIKEVGVASQQAQTNTNTLSNNYEKLKNIIASKFLGGFTDEMNSLVKGTINLLQPTQDLDAEFRNLKASTDDFNKKLDPLVARYDELKGKTTLNKDEQTELNNIIRKIVEIMPQAVGEVDKYGKALDINRKAVKDFREENDKFVRDSQAKTIDKLQAQAVAIKKEIDLSLGNMEQLKKQYAQFNIPLSEQKGLKVETTALATAQKSLIELNDKLEGQYKTKLPASLQKYLDAAKTAAFGTTDKKEAVAITPGGETPEEQAARLAKDAERNKAAQDKALKEQEAAAEKHRKEIEKSLQALEKLRQEMSKLETQLGIDTLGQYEQGLAKINEQYDLLFAELEKNAFHTYEDIQRLEADRQKAIEQYNDKILQDADDFINSRNKKEQDASKTRYQIEIDGINKTFDEKVKLYQGQTEILKKLEQQRRNEIANVVAQQKGMDLVDKFQPLSGTPSTQTAQVDDSVQTEQEKQIQHNIEQWRNYAGQVYDIISSMNAAVERRETAMLNKELKQNDERKKSIQKLVSAKTITEIEGRRQIAAIEQEEAAKKEALEKKQFERAKKQQIAQAIVNGAMAITSTLAARPGALDVLSLGAFRAINIAIAVASTAAQIATISSQKYGKGGRLNGPSHSNGGMPVINPNTGQKEAEVEGGEYILSKSTVANNRPLADALLNASMYGGGRSVAPVWNSKPYQPINFIGVTQSIQKTRFADGGIFNSNQTNAQTQQVIVQSDDEMKMMLAALMRRLNQPIQAVSNITLRQIDDAYTRKDNILKEATP